MNTYTKDDIIQFYKENKPYKIINWKLTKWCNYRCQYCISLRNSNKNTDNDFPKYEDLSKSADILNKLIEDQNDNVEIQLIGGEVTWLPIKRLITEHLTSKKIIRIKITSNMSQSYDWWVDFSNFCKEKNILLDILGSMHPSQIKDINNFVKNIVFLSNERPKNTAVTAVFNNDNIDDLLSKFKLIEDNGYKGRFSIGIERQKGNVIVNLTDENKKKLEKYTAKNLAFTVELKNGEILNINKADLIMNFGQDFNSFNCEASRFQFKNNKLYICVCKGSTVEVDSLNMKPVICNQNVCSLCFVGRVYRNGAIDYRKNSN